MRDGQSWVVHYFGGVSFAVVSPPAALIVDGYSAPKPVAWACFLLQLARTVESGCDVAVAVLQHRDG